MTADFRFTKRQGVAFIPKRCRIRGECDTFSYHFIPLCGKYLAKALVVRNKIRSFATDLKERIHMATNRKNIVVHTINLEELEKVFPINSEVTMPPLPEGHVAKLASIHLVKTH